MFYFQGSTLDVVSTCRSNYTTLHRVAASHKQISVNFKKILWCECVASNFMVQLSMRGRYLYIVILFRTKYSFHRTPTHSHIYIEPTLSHPIT